jgi:hypothetical protein
VVTALAGHSIAWVVVLNVEVLSHRRRADQLQNHHPSVDARLVAAAVPVQHLAAFFFWLASGTRAMKVQYPVDPRRCPNPSETFWKQDFR